MKSAQVLQVPAADQADVARLEAVAKAEAILPLFDRAQAASLHLQIAIEGIPLDKSQRLWLSSRERAIRKGVSRKEPPGFRMQSPPKPADEPTEGERFAVRVLSNRPLKPPGRG